MEKWIRYYMIWLCIALCVAGGGMFAVGWWRHAHFAKVMARGTPVVAVIDRAQSISRKGLLTYTINLAWQDADGNAHKATGVVISGKFAEQIIRNGGLVLPSVEIRYLAAAPAVLPVVVADAEAQQSGARQLQIWGAMLALLGIAGGAFWGWVWPRIWMHKR